MKSYTYVAKSKNGKEVRGTINAEDVKDFMAQAKAKNLEIKGYEEKDVKDSKSIRKFKTEELSFCCRQLAAMLTSGLTLVKALDILSKEQPTEQAKEVWQSIYENVQKGESFSSSLEQYRGVFPEFLISMVGAGESSGSLDTIMQRMSDHYQKEQKMNNTIKGAMTYPIILGFLCIVIIIAMFTFIMPTFAGLYESPDDMPAFTKAMMAFSDSLVHYWFVYIIVIGAIVFGITYIMKIPSTRLKFDKLIIKGPGFGPLVVKIYTARFARTLSSLYSSGIPMVECLQRSSSILGNRYIDELFENVVDEVKQGETLYNAPKDGSVLMYAGGGQVPPYYSGSWEHNLANPEEYTIVSSMVGLAVPSGAVMVTQPDKPFNTWPELVEYIKANPNTLTVAVANGTPHEIRMKLLFQREGLMDMVRWISGTNNDISTGLLGGNIDIGMLTETAGPQYIHEGDLKGLIYSNWLRNYADNEVKPVLDAIDTVADIYGDEEAPSLCCAWPMALAGPAGMDEALCDKIAEVVNGIVDSEEFMQRVRDLGGTNTFQAFTREEMREMMDHVDEQVRAFYGEG